MKKPVVSIAILSVIFILVVACSLPGFRAASGPTATMSSETEQVLETQNAFQTLAAMATSIALGTPVAIQSDTPGTQGGDTETPGSGTSTPYATLTPYPSLTPAVIPTLTPYVQPSAPPTLTAPAVACNQAQFVADVSVPDGTKFWPNERFFKAWRLKNIGSCTWGSDYGVVFAGGDQMGGADSANLGVVVRPGEVVDVVVPMRAPTDLGDYLGFWKLRTQNGTWFGIGTGAGAFTADISVVTKPTFRGTLDFNVIFNFCSATWSTPQSTSLYCTGVPTFSSNIVYRQLNPVLEGNRQENDPALVTVPSNGSGGYIQGRYPPFLVRSGDHFTTVVGCLQGATNCSVKYDLNYMLQKADGTYAAAVNLWSWKETYDGNIHSVNIDLSSLAGSKISLILKVSNDNGSSQDDRAFWLSPVVARQSALSLKKEANPTTFSAVGNAITYSYTVTNSGTTTLAGPFTVKDDKAGDVACPAGSLAPGASVICAKGYNVVQGDLDAGKITNTAYVTDGTIRSTSVALTINGTQSKAISLAKSANPNTYSTAGEVITYTFTVTNSGNVTLAGPFAINDDKLGKPSCATGSLAPGASGSCNVSYTIKQADVDAGSITNTATASFAGSTSSPATTTITATQTPLLTLTKTATEASYKQAGDIIHYTFVLANAGNVTLLGPYTVADPKVANLVCPTAPASLAPGLTVTCTAEYTVQAGDLPAPISNTATASAIFNGSAVNSAADTVDVPNVP